RGADNGTDVVRILYTVQKNQTDGRISLGGAGAQVLPKLWLGNELFFLGKNADAFVVHRGADGFQFVVGDNVEGFLLTRTPAQKVVEVLAQLFHEIDADDVGGPVFKKHLTRVATVVFNFVFGQAHLKPHRRCYR